MIGLFFIGIVADDYIISVGTIPFALETIYPDFYPMHIFGLRTTSTIFKYIKCVFF